MEEVCQQVRHAESHPLEEDRDGEEQVDTLAIRKHSSTTIPVPHADKHKETDVFLADDELGKALQVMAAVQASDSLPGEDAKLIIAAYTRDLAIDRGLLGCCRERRSLIRDCLLHDQCCLRIPPPGGQ